MTPAKRFLAEHFCKPAFRKEWLEIEHQYHDADMWAFHHMRGLLEFTPEQLRRYVEQHAA